MKYIKIGQIKNKGQLKQLLIQLGLGSDMANHKAFDVLLEEIIGHLGAGSRLSEVDMKDGEVSIGYDEEAKQISILSVPEGSLAASISVSNNLVNFSMRECPKGETFGHEMTTGSLFVSGKLDESVGAFYITSIAGSTHLDRAKTKEQYEYAFVEERRFDPNGLELEKIRYEGDRLIDRHSSTAKSLGASTYQLMATSQTPKKRIALLRTRIDVARVLYEDKTARIMETGYTRLGSEYGLKTMQVSPGFYGDYIAGSIPPLTEEEYAKKMVSGNSSEVQEALGKRFNPRDRLNFTWQREQTDIKKR